MLTQTEAEQLALNFLINDLEIPQGDRDWFKVKTSRTVADEWYIVELQVEGYPDTWAIQVYETRACDPCYTFMSPLAGSATADDLAELPEAIAKAIAWERKSQTVLETV